MSALVKATEPKLTSLLESNIDEADVMASTEPPEEKIPFPTSIEEFDEDPRISYDRLGDRHILEDEIGEEWEWVASVQKWISVV